MMDKLIDMIRRSDFNPDIYNGFMHGEFLFFRYFPLNENSLRETFDSVNNFLLENGYETFHFDDFKEELSVNNEKVSLYADPYVVDDTRKLILVIEKYSPSTNPIDRIILELIRFRNERDWKKFHNPKDLALAINVEAGELLELFLWKNSDEANEDKIKEELADVFIFAFLLAEKYGFDVNEIVLDKIERNAEKYPIDKVKGTAKKYNEL